MASLEQKSHVTMQKVVEHFQSNWLAGYAAPLMEVVPPPTNVDMTSYAKCKFWSLELELLQKIRELKSE